MADAIVYAGAASKGAFGAGALSVLTEPDVKTRLGLDVVRLVGASSGALNAAFHAGAIRAGDELGAGRRLADLWIERATVFGTFDFSLRDIVRETGLSTDANVLKLLRETVPPRPGSSSIDLRIVVTNTDGRTTDGFGTDFKRALDFTGRDFDTAAAIERVYLAVAASAALPGIFAPVPIELDGRVARGLDGGLVDDTPIGHALAGAPAVSRVFVVAPFPFRRTEPPDLGGIGLAGHILDILVEQRLYRDLRGVARVNESLSRLAAAVPEEERRAAVLDALGWTGRRTLHVVQIRPAADLPGNALSGFASRSLREAYVQSGIDAARAVVAALGTG